MDVDDRERFSARSNESCVPGSTPSIPGHVCPSVLRGNESPGGRFGEPLDGCRYLVGAIFGRSGTARFRKRDVQRLAATTEREPFYLVKPWFDSRRIEDEASLRRSTRLKNPKSIPPAPAFARTTRTRARGQHRVGSKPTTKASGSSESSGDGDGSSGGEDDHPRLRLVAAPALVPPPSAAEYSATYTSAGDARVRDEARARVTQVLSDILRRT